jgi:16S rRNA (uracil1498-N3)-methyltransferase
MKINRLFVPEPISAGQDCVLAADRAHYVERVLRLRAGDALRVFDGSGVEFPAVIVKTGKRQLHIQVGQPESTDNESPLHLHLVAAISRGDRMDFAIQKATELGVSRVSPVLSERSVVRLSAERAKKRLEHWRSIVHSACEQCGRNTLPQVDLPLPLTDWYDRADTGAAQRLVLKPGATRSLGSQEMGADGVVLLVGPEGGFSEQEYLRADAAGFAAVSMGPRVLRTETAALAAIAVLQSKAGDAG